MSAHHYFRDFCQCDSGMIPWLLMAELVSKEGNLHDRMEARRAALPSSGEINFTLPDVNGALARVRSVFTPRAVAIDEKDGIGIDMGDWRFNIRRSNTEPVLRQNVWTRGDRAFLDDAVAAFRAVLLE